MPEAALPVALLSVGQVTVLVIFRRALSEVVFMPLLIWAVNALEASLAGPKGRRGLLATAVLLMVLLALSKQAGILLVGGFGLGLCVRAWQRQVPWRRAARLMAAVSLPVLAILLAATIYDQTMKRCYGSWSNLEVFFQRVGPAEIHSDSLPLWQQLLEGCRLRISEIGRLTIPGMFNAHTKFGDWINVNMAMYLPLCAVICWGWCRLIRGTLDIFLVTVPLYVALYIYWPFDQAGRYFAPILPVLFMSLWAGLECIRSQRRIAFGLLAGAHLAVATGFLACVDRPAALLESGHWPELQRLAEYLRDDPDPVQVTPGLKGDAQILSYLLDRRVTEQTAGSTPPGPVHWLVVAGSGRHQAGYAPCLATEHFCLLRRDESIPR
jgi:hypothetical protein